jgi:DNA polymerase III delta subunit
VITKARTAPPKNDLPQTWILCGDDPRFFEEHAKRWADRWGGGDGALSLPAPGLAPSAFHTEVNSMPFLKERQVVRLKHLEGATVDLLEAVATYGKNPSPTTALLVEFLGSRPKAGKKAPTRQEQALESLFGAVPALECRPPSVKAYAERRLREAGLAPEPGALDALEEWAVKDVAKVASALDLLLLYRAGETVLQEEDVATLLGAGGTPQRWALSDAFVSRDAHRFRTLLPEVERDPEVQREGPGTAIAFVGMVAKQVRALLVARGITDSGEGREAVVKALAGEPLKMLPYPSDKVLNALPRWSEERIRQALGTLFRLDLALKGGAEPAPAWTLVERYLSPLLGGTGSGGARAPKKG